MFVDSINPVLATLGPFSIRYYGLVYVLGFVIAYFFLRSAIKTKRIKISYDSLDNYFILLIIVSIIGARLFEVFVYNWSYYSSHFYESYMIWDGGMAIQGGILGAAIVTYIFVKRHKISFYDITDLLVVPASFTIILGKIANYANSELYGTITSPQATPWCVVFAKNPAAGLACRHPEQIYEAIAFLLLFIAIFYYYKHTEHQLERGKGYAKGLLMWGFLGAYSLIRFVLTFLRDEPKYYLGPIELNVGQWGSIVIIIISGIFIYLILSRKIGAQHQAQSKNI